MFKCRGITKAGKSCNYKAKENGFCGRHKNFISIDDLTSKVEKMKIEEVGDLENASIFIKRLLACKDGDEIADLLMESP